MVGGLELGRDFFSKGRPMIGNDRLKDESSAFAYSFSLFPSLDT